MRAGASLGSQLLFESNENPSGSEIAGSRLCPSHTHTDTSPAAQGCWRENGRELVCEGRGRASASIKYSLRTRCSGEMGGTYGWIPSSGGVVVAHNICSWSSGLTLKWGPGFAFNLSCSLFPFSVWLFGILYSPHKPVPGPWSSCLFLLSIKTLVFLHETMVFLISWSFSTRSP